MVSTEIYEQCLPILENSGLEEEDKTDKLEELLRKDPNLSGKALEDAILSILWRHRDSIKPSGPSPHLQQSSFRRGGSPAPWQVSRTATPITSPPLTGVSPAPGFGVASPALARTRSSIASPFVSPRPSPRLAFASSIPHSPNLNSYEFSEPSTHINDYGDFGSDTVDWLVGEEPQSRPSSSGAPNTHESTLSAAAVAWVQPQQTEMSPYDMLRSILGESKSDEEIEGALETNGYDLSTTIMMLMGDPYMFDEQHPATQEENHILIGKSMVTQPISINAQKQRSSVVCKYWLSTGNCLRADCRFSHDLTSHICKYWVMGSCLAGDSCVFSHDPAGLINNLNIENGKPSSGSSPASNSRPNFQIQDYTEFPSLQPGQTNWNHNHLPVYQYSGSHGSHGGKIHAMGSPHLTSASPRSYGSRPTSRHSSRAGTPFYSGADDTEAFPSLIAAGKGPKKQHGKRGHTPNPSAKENTPISLADAIRMSPSPAPAMLRKGLTRSRSYVGNPENSAASQAIAAPEQIPWLETGDKLNLAYAKARQEAFKHGGMRNKFLQSAAQAWNRNDARAAKALSLRGQSENDLMRKAHREAARFLYEDRNRNASSSGELYIDLHGLHPEEAVEYLGRVLSEQQSLARPIYAITGTGHHSKNGKDKVGKALRTWLTDWKYAFREFSVPGDRGNVGGILGIDPKSCEKTTATTMTTEMTEEKKATMQASTSEGTMTNGAESGISGKTVTESAPTGPKIQS